MNEAEPPDTTDQRFAQNLRAAREHAGMSQAALAAEMSAMGFAFHQQTIARIEGGTQRVRLSEALALSLSVRTNLDALARPTGMALEALQIMRLVSQVYAARQDVASATGRVAEAERGLQRLLTQAAEAGHGEALADEIALGKLALRDEGPDLGLGRAGAL